jgi:hypothetical protein
MAPTTDIRDCQKFASAITAAGGTVPDVLGHLLSAYQLLASPACAQRPESDILTHALDGTLDQKTLDRLLPAAATAAMANTYRGELARQSETHPRRAVPSRARSRRGRRDSRIDAARVRPACRGDRDSADADRP